MKSSTTLHWTRVDTDTIECGNWQIRVVGTNASAKPTHWGVYTRGGPLRGDVRDWVEVRGAPSKRNKLGSDVTFESQRDAKDYVEWKITGTHPREAERKAHRAALRAAGAVADALLTPPFTPDAPKITPEQARVVLLRCETALRAAMNKLNGVLVVVCSPELSPRSPEAKATDVGKLIDEIDLTIGAVNEAISRT